MRDTQIDFFTDEQSHKSSDHSSSDREWPYQVNYIPVGNPVALRNTNTQHTGKEILTRPTSEYFANDPDCVVLLCLIPIHPQIFVIVHIWQSFLACRDLIILYSFLTAMYTIQRHLDERMYRTCFCIYTVSTKNKARYFFALFYLGLMKFYKIWSLTYSPSLFRTQLQLHFQ